MRVIASQLSNILDAPTITVIDIGVQYYCCNAELPQSQVYVDSLLRNQLIENRQ